jgi:hypothetical protein
MVAATHICTHCGYEGKPVKPPSDETDGAVQSDGSKAIARLANLVLPGSGMLIRPLAMLVSVPIYLLLWPLKRYTAGGPKHCPNCGLPLMVRLNSDAGWIAKRKLDIRDGLVVIGEDGKARPGTGNKVLPPVVAAMPDPGKLAHVDVLLKEAPTHVVEMKDEKKEEVVEEPVEKPVTKKPVKPDEW